MYDLDGDNFISKEEVLAVLTMMVGTNNISKEQLSSISERTIKEADGNKDKMISFDEFCKAMEKIDIETKMSIHT